MKYKIVVDASCDIPKEYVDKYGIIVVPIEVRFGDELYPEGLDSATFYKKVRETGIIPKTSMPNQYLFEELLSPYVNDPEYHVIVVTISSEMTATIHQVEGAVQALKMQNVTYRQSGVATWAHGAVIAELLKFIEKDDTLEHVIAKLDELIRKVKLYAVIGDLKYLRASGRLSATSQIVGSMLNIKPIISLTGGKVTNEAKVMGEAKAHLYMINKAKDRDEDYPVYFGNSDCRKLVENFVEKCATPLSLDPKKQEIFDISYVVGTHVGPNCYGIVYFAKD